MEAAIDRCGRRASLSESSAAGLRLLPGKRPMRSSRSAAQGSPISLSKMPFPNLTNFLNNVEHFLEILESNGPLMRRSAAVSY